MRKLTLRSLAGFLGALAALAFSVSANAAVVLNDSFNYPDGTLSGQGGWTATASAATPIQVVNGAVQLNTSGQDEYKALSSPVANVAGNSLYTSADINVSAAQTGDYFLHLSNPAGTTTNFFQRLFVRSSGAGYQLGLVDTSGTGSTTTWGTNVLNFNETYQVVVAWNFVASGTNNDTFAVYVNPTSAVEGNNTTYLTHTWTSTSIAEPAQLAAANLRQGSSSAAPTLKLDNLAVATEFSEVVPEPAALSLLAIGGLGLLARRRRA